MDDSLLHSPVQAAGASHPNSTAVIFDDGKEREMLTYRSLLDESEKIASFLTKHKCLDSIIGICLNTSVYLPVHILGILSCNSAFFNIDNRIPTKPLCNILRTHGIRILMVEFDLVEEWTKRFQHLNPTLYKGNLSYLMVLNEIESSKSKWPLAYMITTSGTTSLPKIVKVPHNCIAQNISDLGKQFEIKSTDVILQVSPLTFDPSVVEIFLALSFGATLLMIPLNAKLETQLFTDIFQRNGVTVLQVTPTLLRGFHPFAIKSVFLSASSTLKVLAFGGEAPPNGRELSKWKSEGNSTKIFNLYGITEVSCWATCHFVTESDLKLENPIPLGQPLQGTLCTVDKDTNELFIGGHARVCLVDDEEELKSDTMRPTGDIVMRNEKGLLIFSNRKDDQVKRRGQRINLAQIEQVCRENSFIQNAAAIFFNSKIYLLVQAEKQKYDELSKSKGMSVVKNEIESATKKVISDSLPHYCLPDKIHNVQVIPITKHGKADKTEMLKMVEEIISSEKINTPDFDRSDVRNVVMSECANSIGASTKLTANKSFLDQGGNSFLAVTFSSRLQTILKLDFKLIDIILSQPLESVITKIEELINAQNIVKNIDADIVSEYYPPYKRAKVLDDMKETVYWISRGSKQFLSHTSNLNVHNQRVQESIKRLHVSWKFSTGKCVDASPLLVITKDIQRLYIGSHSNILVCLCATSGKLIWQADLPDRIESSACLSPSCNGIVVGCYDGCVYVLSADSGLLLWRFQTNGPVKSSPSPDIISKLVFAGSHDHCVYGLDIQKQECVWKNNLCSGSVFSSPLVTHNPHHLYVTSLSGCIAALNPLTGDKLWSNTMPASIFSSPEEFPFGICFGCVNGLLYAYNHCGEKLWVYETAAPIFSSPVISPSYLNTTGDNKILENYIIIGSHDNYVHCVNKDGHRLWKHDMGSHVYATSFIVMNMDTSVNTNEQCSSSCENDAMFLISCSSKGLLKIIELENGNSLAEHIFPNEVFSSPICYKKQIFVGCRDDYIYKLNILP